MYKAYNIIQIILLAALTLNINDGGRAHADTSSDQSAQSCYPDFKNSRIVSKEAKEQEDYLYGILVDKLFEPVRILHTQEDGFSVAIETTDLVRFNLGMDSGSKKFLIEERRESPNFKLTYNILKKNYKPMNEGEYKEALIKESDFLFSDCSAIGRQEKRIIYEIEVGKQYREGKYIYAIKLLPEGKIKLLLGDPKRINKEKIDGAQGITEKRAESAMEIANSVVGEELVTVDELFRQVEVSARVSSKSSTLSYAITDSSIECLMKLRPFWHDLSDMGCSNHAAVVRGTQRPTVSTQVFRPAGLLPNGEIPPVPLTRPSRSKAK